jgi:outer membrane protein TolC
MVGGVVTLMAAAPVPVLKITPQMVVDQVLREGTSAKAAELQAKIATYNLETALGIYDIQLTGKSGYEQTEAQNMTFTNDVMDRTFTFSTLLQKKLSTGTTVGLGLDHTFQNATLNAFASTARKPTVTADVLTLTVRQALLANSFGRADRLNIEIAEANAATAKDSLRENLEGVILNGLTLFWNAYVAQEQFKQNLSARDKYDQLVKNVRRKAGFNLSTPGELPRLEAELNNTEARVKTSSADYLSSVESLLTSMRLNQKAQVEFIVSGDLPPVPQLKACTIDDLRTVRVANVNAQNAERNFESVKNQGLPKLDLVAKGQTTGVEEERERAIAEMTGGRYPTYFVGVEFSMAFDSNALHGQTEAARTQVEVARNNLTIQKDTARDQINALERAVVANHENAKMAQETVEFRGKVVKELEVSYRQGRQPLVELIRAYNDLFAAELDRARAVGQYHISLNQLAAARDELIGGQQ